MEIEEDSYFLGVAESSTFVGTHYILGVWYAEKELGKRSVISLRLGSRGRCLVVSSRLAYILF